MISGVFHLVFSILESICVTALTLALTRDGSSGGVVRVAIITKDGAERRVFLHNELPQFYQG